MVFKEKLGQDNVKNKLLDLFEKSTTSLARSILLVDYINNLRSNWETTYTSTKDKNKENNANAINNNANIMEEQERNMENSDDINF